MSQRVKNLHARQETGYTGSISGLGRSPGGGGHGTPLQYSCLENPMDSGAFGLQLKGSQRVRHNWATIHTCSIEKILEGNTYKFFNVSFICEWNNLSIILYFLYYLNFLQGIYVTFYSKIFLRLHHGSLMDVFIFSFFNIFS